MSKNTFLCVWKLAFFLSKGKLTVTYALDTLKPGNFWWH